MNTDDPSPKVPLELLELIIDNVSDDDVDDDVDEVDFYSNAERYGTYRACCLVCHALLPRSRRNLLRRVCITNMTQLERFTRMIDNTVSKNRAYVRELIVLSTPSKPSPATTFPLILAGKLPNLRCVRLRTEMGPVSDPTMRPAAEFHRNTFAALSSLKEVVQLELFGLRFLQYNQFFRLVSSMPQLSKLQCMQLWFNPSATRTASDLYIPDRRPVHPIRLSYVDLAFVPRAVMKGLFHGLDPNRVKHLIITPNKAPLTTDVGVVYGDVAMFRNLESFTFFIAVTAEGADYAEVLALVMLLHPNVRTITLSHYLHGPARNHIVPKRTMIDALSRDADELQRSLDPGRFSTETRVILQFQGFHNSEVWWIRELEPILPKLSKVQHHGTGGPRRYLFVENVTYDDWSPWEDDKDRSAPS